MTAEPESLSHAGAEHLARRIERFWRDRGKTVHAWVERVNPHSICFGVRTDMINGAPRG